MEALINKLTGSDPDRSYEAQAELVELGPQCVLPLLNALAEVSDRDRYRILNTLTLIGDKRAVPGAVQCLHSDNAAVLTAATQCLGELGGYEALNALLNLVEQRPSRVSMMWVIKALAKFRDPRIVPALVGIVETTSSHVDRYTAIEVLAEVGDSQALSVIQKFAQDENHHVRSRAKVAMEKLGAATSG